jgi:hypothetical protein
MKHEELLASFELLKRMINGPMPEGNACMEWPRARKFDGYGKVRHKGKQLRAHRVAFELTCGPIAPGLQVLHECDNPACFRPNHLFLGTNAENRVDSVRKGRHRAPRGEASGRSRLTEDQVREIRDLMSKGATQRPVARLFGVSQSAISLIYRGINWAHIPREEAIA